MNAVWHVDKYKITFKLVVNWTNEILQRIVVSSDLSRPGIIDVMARYREVEKHCSTRSHFLTWLSRPAQSGR